MSTDGERPIRAFRPSRYGLPDDQTEEAEMIRLANVEVYTKRASAGLPIFEEVPPAAISHKPRR
jgi:hypothetical protein